MCSQEFLQLRSHILSLLKRRSCLAQKAKHKCMCCGLILLLVENFCKPAHFFLTSLFFSNQEYNFKPAYFCKPAHFFLTSLFFSNEEYNFKPAYFCKPAHFFLTSLFFSNQEYYFKPAYFCKPAHFFLTSLFFFKPGI